MMATKKKKTAPSQAEPQSDRAAETAREQPAGIQTGEDLAETPVGVIAGETDRVAAVFAARGLNLRTGPGYGYPIAELLQDGTLLAVPALPYGAEVSGWALVHTGQRTGWVDIRFIRTLEPAAEA